MSCDNLHARHWFAPYGMPGVRAPYCVRGCGTPNPRPLGPAELRSYARLMELRTAERRARLLGQS